MNIEQIERFLEREMDKLDARLMSGALTQAQYDDACLELLREETDLLRELREKDIERGVLEHAAWYGLSAELD